MKAISQFSGFQQFADAVDFVKDLRHNIPNIALFELQLYETLPWMLPGRNTLQLKADPRAPEVLYCIVTTMSGYEETMASHERSLLSSLNMVGSPHGGGGHSIDAGRQNGLGNIVC
jgi:hypothetical protein